MEKNNSNLRFCYLSAIIGHGISCQQNVCVSNRCYWCCRVMWRNDEKAEKGRRSELCNARCERSSVRWNGGQVGTGGTESFSPIMLVSIQYQHQYWCYGQLAHPFRVYGGKKICHLLVGIISASFSQGEVCERWQYLSTATRPADIHNNKQQRTATAPVHKTRWPKQHFDGFQHYFPVLAEDKKGKGVHRRCSQG